MALRVAVIVLCLAGLSVADGRLSKPVNVHFSSVNTENILRWSSASDSPTSPLFDVQYIRYGSQTDWREVPHCTNTSGRSCDLTEETWESNETFIARVRSVVENMTSEWQWSMHFRPIDKTFLGTPTFEVRVDLNQLVVSIDPLVLRRGSRVKTMRDVFGFRLVNKIRIRENGSNQLFQEFNDSGEGDPWRSGEQTPGKVYCVSVRASVNSRDNARNSSSEKCRLIPPLPQAGSDVQSVAVGVTSAVIFTIVVLCVFFGIFYHHLSKKPEIPSVLKSFMGGSKYRGLLDYPVPAAEVVLPVSFDTGGKLPRPSQEPGDAWRDINIAQASSVDSGIDLSGHSGSQGSGQSAAATSRPQTSAQSAGGVWTGEPDREPNHYMQQRPETVHLRIPAAAEGVDARDSDRPDSPPTVCGYQKQSSSGAGATRPASPPPPSPPPTQDTVISFSSPGHLHSTDSFSIGILTLDDLLMTEATL